MLAHLAQESAFETPTAEDLARPGPQAQGQEALEPGLGARRATPRAKIAKMRRHDPFWPTSPGTRWIWNRRGGGIAALHPADEGDTTFALAAAKARISRRWIAAPIGRRPGRMCDRQGLSLTVVLPEGLDDGPWKTGSPSPAEGVSRWHGLTGLRQAVTNNRTQLLSAPRGQGSLQAAAPRSSIAPLSTTSIAAACARTWLRGREIVHKRYLLHVAGHNLSLLMRIAIGAGTQTAGEAVAGGYLYLRAYCAFSRSDSLNGPMSRRMAKPPSSRYGLRRGKPGQ